MGMANPKTSQEKPRDPRPRRDPRGLTSRELPRLRLHETSQEASLLLVSGEPRKVGREGRRALDPEPEDIVKARRLRRLAGQVGCGRLQSARTASPPKRGVEWRSSERLWLSSAGGSETPGARRKGKGGRVVLTLFTVQRSGGPMPDTVSDSVRRAMLASLVRSAHPSSASSHSRRPAIDSIAIGASPTLGLSVFSTPKRKLPALQKFRRQTFLKGAGDLSPRHRNNAR